MPQDYTKVDASDIGLERSTITQHGKTKIPYTATQKSNDPIPSGVEFKEKKHQVGIEIKKKLHLSKHSGNHELSSPLSILAKSPGDQKHSRLDNANTEGEKPKWKNLAHHPVETIRSMICDASEHQVASSIAAKEIPHGQDVDVVTAASEVEDASSEKERILATQKLSELLKMRQSMFVRWTLDRHVSKVRVLPRDTVTRKPRAAFEHKNAQSRVDVDWCAYGKHLLWYYAQIYGGQYIGYGSDPPSPSKETILPSIERLLIATSPLQELIMTTRRVYCWEYPVETAKYLCIYMVLWYFNLLLPGLLSWLVYIVAERRVHGMSIEDLREDIKHTEDQTKTALSITEFIEKRGDEHWADQLLHDLGPWLMVQLADAANFFETTRNFYEWRKPHRTCAILGVLSATILITALIPPWLVLKSATLSMALVFFALFPLSAHWPAYRLLVSPTKRLLWNMPTHAEWAIAQIQAEGSCIEASGVATADEHGVYAAHWGSTAGHLILGTRSLRFVSGHPYAVHVTVLYADMDSLEKVNRVVKQCVVPAAVSRDSGEDLKVRERLGRVTVLRNVERRNEAWSQIVGFSKTSWQVVW